MSDYTILLVDYEPRSIQQLQGCLLGAGFHVEVVHDGLGAIEKFKELRPSMVLLEAMLPKKHGFEVCQELKAMPEGKNTPVAIITSVYKGRRYRTQATHLYGADEYIEKPVEDTTLVEICRRLLKIEDKVTAPAEPEAPDESAVADPIGPITEEDIDQTLENLAFGTPDQNSAAS
jgi:DNA-binding response OmpR family regulator